MMINDEVEFVLVDREGTEREFQTLTSLDKFLTDEIEAWSLFQNGIVNPQSQFGKNIITRLTGAKKLLHKYIDLISAEPKNERQIQQAINQLNAQLSSLKSHWLNSNSSMLPFLKEAINSSKNPHAEQAFISYVFSNTITISNKDQFIGTLKAYESQQSEHSLNDEIENKEKQFERLFNNLSMEKTKLVEDVFQTKKDFSKWDKKSKIVWDEWLDQVNEHFINENKNKDKVYSELIESSEQKLNNLRNTYEAHLKLESPAKYWGDMAKKYGDNAYFGIACLFILVGIGLVGFFHFYSYYLQGQDLSVKLDTVKGLILFGTGAAIYTYLIRIASKLTFSSFHLHRDAQEREQLTYFYLALIKEGAIDDESRDIVLQSLFSRTETGLLGNDSSPTMPMADLIKGMRN